MKKTEKHKVTDLHVSKWLATDWAGVVSASIFLAEA